MKFAKKSARIVAELLALIAYVLMLVVVGLWCLLLLITRPFYRAFQLAVRDFRRWERESAIDNGKEKP